MIIGLLYDYKRDYNIEDDLYCDFSYETEVQNVRDALNQLGYIIYDIGNIENFWKKIVNGKLEVDLIFNMIEGFKSRNREGIVPAICEALGIKYIGTDAFGMSLTLHKFHTSLLVRSLGVRTPESVLFDFDVQRIDDLMNNIEKKSMEFPLIVKPNHEGSSMGVTLVRGPEELKDAVKDICIKFSQQVLCQEYILGEEMSVPMIETKEGIKILGIVGFSQSNGEELGIFTTEKKNNNLHLQRSPMQRKEVLSKIEKDSINIFKLLKLRAYCRMDWIVKSNVPYFLEATPLPSFEKGNCFEWCAYNISKSFSDVLKSVIENAI